MIFTDTHTHLYSDSFDADRDQVIADAIEAGVSRFFLPAIDASYISGMRALKAAYPGQMHLMSGLHPTHVKKNFKEELTVLEDFLDTDSCVAVGEIGIDLYWDRTFLSEQQAAFDVQISWAKARNLPIVIHCRDAFDEVFEVLEAHKGPLLRGIFHCFTGTYEQALRAISYGMKLGIGGVLTFKNGGLDRFIDQIELSHLVLETDAPYLAPVPYRGKRNESAYLINVAARLSELTGQSLADIATLTTQNSKDVFGI
ncbi:MAG: TatD family hydrolase [Flavobacteriia bacterium]|nr:TatD family hydrolase [Flavobacteriia bacterium]